MNCERALQLLPAYLEGDLEGGTMEEVASHAASCSSCAGALEELRTVEKLLVQYSSETPSPALLVGGVLRRIDRGGVWRAAAVLFGYPGVLAGIAVLAVVLTVLVGVRGLGLLVSTLEPSPILAFCKRLAGVFMELSATEPLLVHVLYFSIPALTVGLTLYLLFDFSRSR